MSVYVAFEVIINNSHVINLFQQLHGCFTVGLLLNLKKVESFSTKYLMGQVTALDLEEVGEMIPHVRKL